MRNQQQPPMQSSNDAMLNAFSQMNNNKNEIAEVLKELFDNDKIHLISDLSHDEIRIATRIYTISKIKKIKVWERALEFYFRLLLSKDRRSRKEIIDAVRGFVPQQSFLNRINPFSRGR